MKRTLIMLLVLLLAAITTQKYLIGKNKGDSKLKYIDVDRFKNRTGFNNARRSRIVNNKAGNTMSENKNENGPHRSRRTKIDKCPEGKTIKCYTLRGCECI